MINLNQLSRMTGRKNGKKRVGRGQGSGKGSHTTGRGAKGQKVRGKVRLYFEGGQLPITKRLPHQGGFKSKNKRFVQALKLGQFNVFESGQEVSLVSLEEVGLIKSARVKVKIVRGGKLEKKLVFKGLKFTKKASFEASEGGSTVA